MEPTEVNGGRFYIRPLHFDDRINDTAVLSSLPEFASLDLETAVADWRADRRYTWASCEQTNIDMAALIVLERNGDTATITGHPIGDPTALLPNDPTLERKTSGDAATEGVEAVRRWAEGFVGLTVTN